MEQNINLKYASKLIDSSIKKINIEKDHLNEHMKSQERNNDIDKSLNEMNELNKKISKLFTLNKKINELDNAELRNENKYNLSKEDISLLEDLSKERINDLKQERFIQEEFLSEEKSLAAIDIAPSSFDKNINEINESIENIDVEISNLNTLNNELAFESKEKNIVDVVEEKDIIESLELISNEIVDNGVTDKLNDNVVFRALKEDRDLMEKAMLYHQKNKVLDVLTKAKSQLENVNYTIRNDELNEGLKELQINLQQDVNHLEAKAKNIENKIGNSHVINSISNKLNTTKEKGIEKNNDSNTSIKKSNKRKSRSQDLSL